MRPLSSARKGLLAIVAASGAAQLVGLAGMPVISRLFPPEQFGYFAVVNAAVMPAAALASLRLDLAVPLTDERRSRVLVSLGLRSSAAFGLSFFALTVLAITVRGAWTNSGWWTLLPWVPVIAGLVGAFAVLNQFAVRHRAYGAIGRRNILMAIAVVGFQMLAGVLGTGPHGLAAGLAAGQLVGVLSLRNSLQQHLRSDYPREKGDLRTTLWDYRIYPLLMAPAGVVNLLGLTAPVILMAGLFGGEVSGWLGMTQRVLSLPVTLIGLALAQVYLGEFSAIKRGGGPGLKSLFLRTSARLGAAGLAITAVVAMASPIAFPFVLGQQWGQSGSYAVALAAAMGMQMVASPLSQTVIVMGYPALQASWDLLRLLTCTAAVILGYRLDMGDLGTVSLLSGAMCITYFLGWCLSWWTIANSGRAQTE